MSANIILSRCSAEAHEIHGQVNGHAAQQGKLLAHVTLGPVEISVHSPEEAQQIADVFADMAAQLAKIEEAGR